MRQKGSANSVLTRREEIIRVAAKMFAEKGYDATTLDEIAREIGVTKPALYYHINSKDELLQVIVGRIMKLMEEVTRTGRSNLAPRERIEAVVRKLVEFSAENGEATRIAFEQASILHQRTKAAFKRRQKDVDQALQKTLEEGVEQGVFAIDDVKMVSFAVLGACNWIYHWYEPGGYLSKTQVSDYFIHFFENGFLQKPCER
ncbi:MAG: TetR/AcrR family transcriptional regulator [Chloroflexi bacterium]|nr:TetR/AcrR family transcriptional regulator [Chloroflexota bacterium]